MSKDLAELFKHNLWANMGIMQACEGLSAEQLAASAVGTYGSIAATLGHLVGAEERYIVRLTGAQIPEPPIGKDDFPGFPAIAERAGKSGEVLITIAEEFTHPKTLTGIWRGEPYELPASILLTQAINHATEHRVHIATILTQLGIEPPDLDAWSYNDTHKS